MVLRSFHVLLVEDNDAHAKLAVMAIRNASLSASVDRIEDGEQVLSYLHRQPPYSEHHEVNLVLLDLKTARMDGIEVLRQIKADPKLRLIPVVILSATLSHADIRAAYENHANSFLVKPLEFEEFQQMISDMLTYWGRWNQGGS